MKIKDIQMFPQICRTDPMKKTGNSNNGGGCVTGDNGNRLARWSHHSSRIIRVSRASGGKDRHSKVWTSKGPRDRRVRLSVSTALQFYDLQDRLGYDQPSKAVEWLIKEAADSIAELPSLNAIFPTGDVERIASSENVAGETPTQNANKNQDSLSKSGCSSNSETSKNSGLSLSRPELRERESQRVNNDNTHRQASFTELLTGSVNAESETGSVNPNRQWMTVPAAAPMEYIGSGLILGSSQTQFPIQTVSLPFSSISGHHHHQELSFVHDHLIAPGGSGSFNLDFNISASSPPAMADFNIGLSRGTLQSNSHHNHQSNFVTNLQRFSSDGGPGSGGVPFSVGAPPAENHHHHYHQFQHCYENRCRNSEHKGKRKN